MSATALYTDLSGYYDLMCADIDYQAQSHGIHRLHQLFGNGGRAHLDLACGTGPHARHFLDLGYQSSGVDLNQPMLDQAQLRCPEAQFSRQDMCTFSVAAPLDLITCFLYSIHYSGDLERLHACVRSVHRALKADGLFCFNAVDKARINNSLFTAHTASQDGSQFTFSSGWHYGGVGERQSLRLRIEKTSAGRTQVWHDEHPMVAVTFAELQEVLRPYFDVQVFEHDYDRIVPWDRQSGNAIFVCVKH